MKDSFKTRTTLEVGGAKYMVASLPALEKAGHYRLGDGSAPAAHDIGRSLHVAVAASILLIGALAITIR